jgi:predicted MFS family arabinose efflux permease
LQGESTAAEQKRYIFAALSSSLITIGLVRFAYTPLLPILIRDRWFAAPDVIFLSVASLLGYLVGALIGRPLAGRFTNVHTLRTMNLIASASLAACAFPISLTWFFGWRLLAGLSGGTVVVLVAATVLPQFPPGKRGLAGGAIFLGLGLGISISGTLVPLMLHYGLRSTWLSLAALSALLTALNWNKWPAGEKPVPRPGSAATPEESWFGRIVLIEFGLIAIGLVSTMLFLVDYVTRDLHSGAHRASVSWALYGAGSLLGPLLYGYGVDSLGGAETVRIVLAVQTLATACLVFARGQVEVAVLSITLGTFVSGVIPLAQGWIREGLSNDPDQQNAVWSHATVIYAGMQTMAGYLFSAILAQNGGNHRPLFAVSAAALGVALILNLAVSYRLAGRLPSTEAGFG